MKALPYPLSAWAIVDESYSILNGHENWNSERKFNATADPKRRKQGYDDLVKKCPMIRPLIRAMFQQSWNIHKKYGVTPLRSYLESERITLPELKELVQKLGSAVRKP